MKKTLSLLFIISLLAATAHALILGPSGASTVTYAPNAPTLSSVSSASATSLSLIWSYGTTDASHSAATSVSVYRGTSAGAESGTPVATGVTTSPWADTGLTTSQPYYYYLKAVNTAGSSVASNEASGTPTATVYAPNAPTIGTATAGNASASVAFTPGAVDGTHSAATSYTATSNPGSITGTGASSPISVTGLTNDTAYTFTVTASNSAGTSSASAASNSVTPSVGSGTTLTGFNNLLAGTGAVTQPGSGVLYQLSAPAANDTATMVYTTAVTKSAHTYKVKFNVPALAADATHQGSFAPIALSCAASLPTSRSAAYTPNQGPYVVFQALSAGGYRMFFAYPDSAAGFSTWDITSSSWKTSGATVYTSASLNTTYTATLETTATQWRYTLRDSTDATTLMQSAWTNWSSVTNVPSSLYMFIDLANNGLSGTSTGRIVSITEE